MPDNSGGVGPDAIFAALTRSVDGLGREIGQAAAGDLPRAG